MATRRLYLVRHGEYDWDNEPGPEKGLTARGVEQARLTAKRLGRVPLTALYSSDLARAVQTAEIIRQDHDGIPCAKRSILRECFLPGPFLTNVDAERIEAGRKQAAAAFSEFFRPARGEDKHEIIVSHGNLIRYLVARVLGGCGDDWYRMGTLNCGISQVEVTSDGRMRVLAYNDAGHLPPRLTTHGVPGKPRR